MSKIKFSLVFLFGLGFAACNAGITEFLDDRIPDPWTKRRKITIDNSAQAETLSNFPVMVRVDSTRIDYANTQDAGQDIQFRASDATTVLSHEIEKWNESGSSYVWVRVPSIAASSSSGYIWMYYGNTKASDGQSATAVWDSNFKGVWHMNATANDVTANGNNGTNAGTVTTVSGIAGDARSLNGTNYINMSGTSIAANVSAITLSAWINKTGTPGGVGIACFSINNGGTPTGTSRMALETTGSTQLNGIGRAPDAAGSGSRATTTGSGGAIPNAATWYLVTAVYNFSGQQLTFYVNGVLQTDNAGSLATWSATTDNTISASAAIGAFDDGTSGFPGIMDEVRFSNTVRSAAWLAADYKSMSDTFLSFSSEEASPGLQ